MRFWLAVLIAALLVGPQTRAAASPKQEAREYARQGGVAYNMGRYEEAAEHYEQAYRLVQDPNILFNIAQSYRLANNPEKALATYKGFLRTAPPDHTNRRVAEEHVAELEAQIAKAEKAQQQKDKEPPPAAARAGGPDAFHPFGALMGTDDQQSPIGDDSDPDGLLALLSPVVGGTLTLGNQEGVQGGLRSGFQAFARARHSGREYELGYFILPIFAPNPQYHTSALYFRFKSAANWYVQAGALGTNGDYHGGGGMTWDYLSVGARLESVGDQDLCNGNAGDSAKYLIPELHVDVPVISKLRAVAFGAFRYALFHSSGCVFHPSMSTLDLDAVWKQNATWSARAGLGFYQFFDTNGAVRGPWPMAGDTAGNLHLGARYVLAAQITLVASYRRIFYSGGINELIAGLEVGLGPRPR